MGSGVGPTTLWKTEVPPEPCKPQPPEYKVERAKRCVMRASLPPRPPLSMLGNARMVQKLLAGFEKILPLKHPSQLHEPQLATQLHAISGGNLGDLHRLLIECANAAILSGAECIDALNRLGNTDWRLRWETPQNFGILPTKTFI